MTDFSHLDALFLNCSLKYDPADSHTARLIARSAGIMAAEGVSVETVHALEHVIPHGMSPDMTDQGRPRDDWPQIQAKIMAADIFVMGTPIWLGVKSSVAALAVERMYASSGETNEKGQYLYYGKTAGCIVTGNEDGVKACAMDILYAMSHIGYTIPPQADCGWIGEVGPGPSYGDVVEGSDVPTGYDSEFTNKNCTFMSWNLMHTAAMLRANGGISTDGNRGEDWRSFSNAANLSPDPIG